MTHTVTPRRTAAPASVPIDGARVRELRQLSGLKLREFGERAEISTQYASMIERGDRARVSPPVLTRIAKALKVKPATLRRELATAA